MGRTTLLLFSIYFALASSSFVADCPTYSDYVLGRQKRCNKRDGHKNPRVLNGLTVAECKQECDDSPDCGYFFVSATECRLMRGCRRGVPTLSSYSKGYCAYVAKPVNCEGSWSDYGECSNKCGAGTQSRTFSISQPAQYYGSQCDHNDGETESQACGPPETDTCCDSIVMAGSIFAHEHTNRDGTYVKVKGKTRDNMPVYQNSNGQYLFYVCPRGWAIGSNYHSLSVGLASEFSRGHRACPNEFSSWSMAPFGSSNIEPSISATCAGAEEKVSGYLTEEEDLALDIGEDMTLDVGEDFTVASKKANAQSVTNIGETFTIYGLAFVGLISTLAVLQSAFRRYFSEYKTIDETTKLEEMSA